VERSTSVLAEDTHGAARNYAPLLSRVLRLAGYRRLIDFRDIEPHSNHALLLGDKSLQRLSDDRIVLSEVPESVWTLGNTQSGARGEGQLIRRDFRLGEGWFTVRMGGGYPLMLGGEGTLQLGHRGASKRVLQQH
jgi:hypothetical protein